MKCLECAEMLEVIDEEGKPVKEGNKVVKEPCGCETKAIAYLDEGHLGVRCSDGHVTKQKYDDVVLSERICPKCFVRGERSRLVQVGFDQRAVLPNYDQEYHMECFTCGETWVETVSLRNKGALRFRKDPKMVLEPEGDAA